jgi:acetyl-CoA/propionyl-CoA carboxylase biotin carboxyl carrier protein
VRWEVSGPDGGRLVVGATGTPAAAAVRIGDGPALRAAAQRTSEGLLLTVGGRTTTALVAADGATTWVHLDGTAWSVTELPPSRRGGAAADHDGEVLSPMPGAVLDVRVALGDEVQEGEVLLVVEAMKMEHALAAPFAGTVSGLTVRTGDQVVVDQLLATVSVRA